MKSLGTTLGALLGIGVWLVALALPQSGLAGVRCERDPELGGLSISVTGDSLATIKREGDAIKAFDPSAPKRGCSSGATVKNTDKIELFSGEDSAAYIDLSHGPFAPGLTPDEDRSSEIEWEVSGPGLVELIGGQASDHFRYAGSGLNLNAGVDKDIDLVLTTDSATIFAVNGGGGADKIDALGSPELETFAIGGRGDDTLVATPSGSILEGGPGSDRLIGSPAEDLIATGPGADLVRAGGGLDDVRLSRDRSRDRVNCGAGNDLAFGADRFDHLISCER